MEPLIQFVPFILIFVLFYFLIIRPQQTREKKHKQMLAELKKGDLVVTQGGIHGRVEGFTDNGDTVQVRIAEGVKVDVQRASITFLKKGGELVEG